MASVTCLSCGRRMEGESSGSCTECGGVLVRAEAFEDLSGMQGPDSSDEVERLSPGSRFLRYRVERILGEGAQGVVYLVTDPELNRTVALKTLKPELFASQKLLARFHREAELAGRVRHPFIATIFDYGVHEGTPYFTMEYLEGKNLAEVIEEQGRLSPRMALQVSEALGMALDHAHRGGVVHRDIKPANVLLSGWGETTRIVTGEAIGTLRVLLTDFGIAHDDSAETKLTASGVMIGTPMYMAPEQADSSIGEIDGRTDQYALGAVLYEMLTGEPPFVEETIAQLLVKVATAHPVPPRTLVPGIDRDVETIVLKMLEKDPDRRYPDCGRVVDDIRGALRGEAISARPTSFGEKVLRRVRKNKMASLAGSIAALLALALVGFLLWGAGQADRRELALLRSEAESKTERETELAEWYREARSSFLRGDPAKCREICLRIEASAPSVRLARSLPEKYRSREELQVLARPWRLPLPETYLLLSKVYEGEGEKTRAMGERVRAFHAAIMETPRPSPVAREALLSMGARFEAEGEWDRAAGAYRGVRRQFPGSKEAAVAAVRLFETFSRMGEGERSLSWGKQALLEESLLSAEVRDSLPEKISLRKSFLPARTLSRSAQAWTLADLSGSGRLHLVWIDPAGHLLSTDLTSGTDEDHGIIPGEGSFSLFAVDADGDGRSEIVCFRGDAGKKTGAVSFFKGNGGLVLVSREEMKGEGDRCWATTGDLDGDGKPEVVLGIGYFQREVWIARWNGERFSIVDRVSFFCDPLSATVVDFDGTPGEELLVSTGGWDWKRGYRLIVVKWSRPGGMESESLFHGRTYADRVLSDSGGIYFRNRFPRKHLEAVKKVADGEEVLAEGVYRSRWEGNGYSTPVSVDSWPLEAPGGLFSFLQSDHLRVLTPEGISLSLGGAKGDWTVAEMDDDASPELLRVRRGAEGVEVLVLGQGPVPEVSLPESSPVSREGRPPVLAAVEELYSLGFFEEALRLAESPGREGDPADLRGWLAFRAGNCHRERGKVQKAMEAYRSAISAYPSLFHEVSMAEISMLEREEWWPELSAKLRFFLESGVPSPALRKSMEERFAGARVMAGLRPVVSLEKAPLWSDDPFLVERQAAGEWLWHAPDRGLVAHLLPVPSPSGSFRLRMRFVVEEVGWERQFEWGLARLSGTDPPLRAGSGSLRLQFRFSGSNDAPASRITLRYDSAPAGKREWVYEGNGSKAGDSWVVDAGYAGHLRRLTLRISSSSGERRVVRWENVEAFPVGSCAMVMESGVRYDWGGDLPASLRVEEFTLFSPRGEGRIPAWSVESPEGALAKLRGSWIRKGRDSVAEEMNALLEKGGEMAAGVRQGFLFDAALLRNDGELIGEAIGIDVAGFLLRMSIRYRFLRKADLEIVRSWFKHALDVNFVRALLSGLGERRLPRVEALLESGNDRAAFHLLLSTLWSPRFAASLVAPGK